MDCDGVWDGSLGMEGERKNGKNAGEIPEMADGSELENTRLHDWRGTAKGQAERKGGEKSLGIRGEVSGRER